MFDKDVDGAVKESLESGKVLVVYCKGGDDNWINTWFDHSVDLKEDGVFLEVVEGTPGYINFVQIFPGVTVPSVRLIKQGSSVLVIEGGGDGNWKKLLSGLGVEGKMEKGTETDKEKEKEKEKKPEPRRNEHNKSEKDKIAEETAAAYHKEYQKQLRQSEEERIRILKLVRADKAERLARKDSHEMEEKGEVVEVRDNILDKARYKTDKCVLMFRLTDSKTVTHTFNSSETLNDVRKWVDANRTDGAGPYSFHRNIPRITFTESDELKTLEDLDLAPRSVLLLKPLDDGSKHLNVTDEIGNGIINKMFTGFSHWWVGSHSNSSGAEEPLHEYQDDVSQTRTHSNVNQHASSSNYATPLMAPQVSRLTKDPSEINLASRSVSPNIVKFVNRDDEKSDPEEKDTYNGNNIKLEKKNSNDV